MKMLCFLNFEASHNSAFHIHAIMRFIYDEMSGVDDLFDVMVELEPVTDRWKHIGLALRLDPSELKVIERENRDNLEECLSGVLTLWLKKAYNTERFGEPSWELLARAVAHPAGGDNPVLAEEIAKK